jgi:phosphoribosylanthranilate isomerase
MNSPSVKLKVCGMKYVDNLKELIALAPDYIGFIFYPASPRYMERTLTPEDLKIVPASIQKTGVFVNADTETILSIARKYQLSALQLHGKETPEQCQVLKEAGYEIIKVFGIGDGFDFGTLAPYKPYINYFLFDTQSKQYGGTGTAFDWEVLNHYDNEIPFFLSGGISLENITQIKKLQGFDLYAIDVNSCFETAPGRKDIEMLKVLKNLEWWNGGMVE